MKTILHFIKPYRKLLFFAIIFIICDVIGALYIPTLTADMINIGVKDFKHRQNKTHSFKTNILEGFANNGLKGMKGKLSNRK